MNDVFKEMNIRKMDSNTRKELERDTWRKAQGEEKAAFLGYYLTKGIKITGHNVIRAFLIILFFILLGELGFEMLLKEDSSFNPLPIIICIVLCLLFLLISEALHKVNIKRHIQEIKDNIFVSNALAYYSGQDMVQVMIDGEKLAFDKYSFNETVSPTEYVYDDNNHLKGFRVLLYVVIQDGVVKKSVLGNSAYYYYLEKYKNIEKHDDFIVSASI